MKINIFAFNQTKIIMSVFQYSKSVFYIAIFISFNCLFAQNSNTKFLPEERLKGWLVIAQENLLRNPEVSILYCDSAFFVLKGSPSDEMSFQFHDLRLKASILTKDFEAANFHKNKKQKYLSNFTSSERQFFYFSDEAKILRAKGESDFVALRKAWGLAPKVRGHEIEKGNIGLSLGSAYQNQKKIDSAISVYLSAIQFFENNDFAGLGKAYTNLANVNIIQGNIEGGLDYMLRGLRAFEKTGNKRFIAILNNNLGNLHRQLRRDRESLPYYLMAVSVLEELNDTNNLMKLYNNLASFYSQTEDYDSASFFVEKSLAINQQKDVNEHVRALYIQAEILFNKANYQEALDIFKTCKREYEEMDGEVISRILVNEKVGSSFLALNILDSAMMHFENSLELSLRFNNKDFTQMAYRQMTQCQEKMGNYKMALHYHRLMVAYKDSVYNEKNAEAISRLKTEYETEKKNQQIELLTKDRDIQRLNYDNERANAELIRLESVEREQSLFLLELENQNKEVALKRSKLEIDNTSALLRLSEQEQLLKDAEILRQAGLRKSYILVFSLLMCLLGGIGFLFIYRKRAVYRYELLSLENKLMRSQMKPHFLFNALHSIDLFIRSNQKERASQYLTKFSALIRAFLHNSIDDTVLLDDELNTIKDYLELENESLKGKFTFVIRLDENIESDNILIPPLIIQPFLENAIWHGIAPKESQGNIIIDLKLQGEFLKVNISDDGVGRKNKSKNRHNKKSVGIELTKERLERLNPRGQKTQNIEFTDLPQGLKVTVLIPYKNAF